MGKEKTSHVLQRTQDQSENATGASRSDRPMLRYISVRTRSATPFKPSPGVF